ncbi:MAG: hypothetical protein C3F19_14590 [Rhodocyclales bacterium]|nr:MAG: hypothetical protein C3F19_14590 [Rhodocyclales bacterium]
MNQQLPSYVRNKGAISETYKTSGSYGQFLNECRLDAWRYALAKHAIDVGGLLVDFGCAYGSWAQNWRELGFSKVVGFDVNEAVVDEARANLGVAEVGDSAALRHANLLPRVIAMNGVIVHVLGRQEELNILHDLGAALAEGGMLLFSVLRAEFYWATPNGFEPSMGENSCTQTLDFHLECCREAGLQVTDIIGTFINPWFTSQMLFTASDTELLRDSDMYHGLQLAGRALRRRGYRDPFSEVLLVCERS